MVIKEGYKQTEIVIIPNDWELMKLGDIFEFKNGLNKEKHFFGYGTPILNYMDVFKYSGVIANDIKGKVFLTNQELKAYEVRKGDVFFTRTSETIEEIGVTTTVLEDVLDTVFSGFVLRGRSKNAILDLYFKKYCFSSSFVRKEIISTASYTTRALTNGRLLANVKIAVPTLAEQTAIANALSDADALITGLEKLIAKKRNIKQGAMQQLLKPKEGWEVKKLGEVCDVRDGTHESPQYFESGVTFITSKNIIKAKLDFKDISFISEGDAYLVNQRSKVDKGDILMSMIGTIGNAVLIDFEPEFCIKNIALLKSKKINENFLIQLIHSTSFQKYIESKLDGGIQKFISLGVLRELEIPVPNFIEQTRIATILSDMDAEVSALEQKLEKYKRIKLGMMQELLTGKTRLV